MEWFAIFCFLRCQPKMGGSLQALEFACFSWSTYPRRLQFLKMCCQLCGTANIGVASAVVGSAGTCSETVGSPVAASEDVGSEKEIVELMKEHTRL